MWLWVTELLDRREAERERKRQHELDLRVCHSCGILSTELARSREREAELVRALTKLPEPDAHEPFRSQIELPTKKSWRSVKTDLELKHRKDIKPSVTVENLDEEIKNATR